MASPPFRFTMFDLDSCIEVARTIQDNGGLLSADELASYLRYKSSNNGSFNTRLGNAKLFGLVEGTSSALSPTRRALEILHPDFPEAAERARLDAFEAVPLFRAVFEQYQGQTLPDEVGLTNALTTRWGVAKEKASAVLSRLLLSAEQAGLFRTAGNRSRMIRPTFANATGRAAPNLPTPSEASPATPTVAPGPAAPEALGLNKLLLAALEELPAVGDATEDELMNWLVFFEGALRLVYRLPQPPPTGSRA